MKVRLLKRLRRKSNRYAYVTKMNDGRSIRLSLFVKENCMGKMEKEFFVLGRNDMPNTCQNLLRILQRECDDIRRNQILGQVKGIREKKWRYKKIY